MAKAVKPGALVDNAFFGIGIDTASVAESIDYLTFVERAVCPVISANSCYLIVTKFALVAGSILPNELALAVKHAVLHFTLENVAFAELTCSLTVVNLADLAILLIVNNVTSPVLNDELRQLCRQECNLGEGF